MWDKGDGEFVVNLQNYLFQLPCMVPLFFGVINADESQKPMPLPWQDVSITMTAIWRNRYCYKLKDNLGKIWTTKILDRL